MFPPHLHPVFSSSGEQQDSVTEMISAPFFRMSVKEKQMIPVFHFAASLGKEESVQKWWLQRRGQQAEF